MNPENKPNLRIAQDILADALKKACLEIAEKTGAEQIILEIKGRFTKTIGAAMASIGLIYPAVPRPQDPKSAVDDVLRDLKRREQ